MPKAQKRDRDYFEKRLKAEFPAIYRDFLAGTYKTVNAAAKAAGLVKPPTHLDYLKRVWNRASSAERKAFIQWARGGASTAPSVRSPVTPAFYLEGWAMKRIPDLMAKKGLRDKDVMKELGLSPLNTSLWRALRRQPATRLKPDLASALGQWLHDNRHL
jgi:hypothetical protein